MSINKVMIIGRLGKDPELKDVNGKSVVNFSMATSESWKDKATGEKKEATEWHNIVAWGSTATNSAAYLKKGSQAYIEGKLTTRKWEDKEGATRYTTEIVASRVQFLDKKEAADEIPS